MKHMDRNIGLPRTLQGKQLDEIRRWVSMLFINVSDCRVKDLRSEELQRYGTYLFRLRHVLELAPETSATQTIMMNTSKCP